jgi:hypothetical protein
MKPIDFKDQKPRLIIEEYLSGNVKAWGILQNRSGKVTRQFSADLNVSGMMVRYKLDNGKLIRLMNITMMELQKMLLVQLKDILMVQHLNLSMFY